MTSRRQPTLDTRTRAWATHIIAREGFRTFSNTAEAEGIRIVPIKGFVLGPLLYDDVGDRPIADVDVLIRGRDLRRLINLGRAQGWQVVRDSKALGGVNFVLGGVAIDVSTSLGFPGMTNLSGAALVDRAVPAELPLGFRHWQLEWHDHVLLMACDAFKDKLDFKRTSMPDLVSMVKRPGFRAERMASLAVEAGAVSLLAVVGDWIAERDGSEMWAAVRTLLPDNKVRRAYLERLSRLRSSTSKTPRTRLMQTVLTKIVADRVPNRGKALLLSAIGSLAFAVRHGSLHADVWQRINRGR